MCVHLEVANAHVRVKNLLLSHPRNRVEEEQSLRTQETLYQEEEIFCIGLCLLLVFSSIGLLSSRFEDCSISTNSTDT